MAKTVYLVQACGAYGGSAPVKAFEAKPDAKKFVKECRAYALVRPVLADGADDKATEKWYKRHLAWERKHPARPFGYYTEYELTVLALE